MTRKNNKELGLMSAEHAGGFIAFETSVFLHLPPCPGVYLDRSEHLTGGAGATATDHGDVSQDPSKIHWRLSGAVLGSEIVSKSNTSKRDPENEVDQERETMIDAGPLLILSCSIKFGDTQTADNRAAPTQKANAAVFEVARLPATRFTFPAFPTRPSFASPVTST